MSVVRILSYGKIDTSRPDVLLSLQASCSSYYSSADGSVSNNTTSSGVSFLTLTDVYSGPTYNWHIDGDTISPKMAKIVYSLGDTTTTPTTFTTFKRFTLYFSGSYAGYDVTYQIYDASGANIVYEQVTDPPAEWTDNGLLFSRYVNFLNISATSGNPAPFYITFGFFNGYTPISKSLYCFTDTAISLDTAHPLLQAATAQSFIPTTRPNPPQSLVASNSSRTITLSWNPPTWDLANDGGIVYYDIYEVVDDVRNLIYESTVPISSFPVLNVDYGKTYTYGVSALNLIFDGSVQEGEMATVTYSMPVGVPSPVYLNVTPGNTQMNLSWTAPADGGSPILGYKITATEVLGAGAVSARAPITIIVGTYPTYYWLSGLTNDQQYEFTILAYNSIGDGSINANSTLSDTPSSSYPNPPSAPVLVSAIPGNSLVTLVWNATAGATLYNIWQDGQLLASTGATVSTIPGLTNGQSYSFNVSATNGSLTPPLTSNISNTLSATPAAPIITNEVTVKAALSPVGVSTVKFTQGAYRNAAGTKVNQVTSVNPAGSITPLNKAFSWDMSSAGDAGNAIMPDPYTTFTTYTITTGTGYRYCILYIGLAVNSHANQTTYTYRVAKKDGTLFNFSTITNTVPYYTITATGSDLTVTVLPSILNNSGKVASITFESAESLIGSMTLVSRVATPNPILTTPQAVAFVNSIPPLSCFGAETLVLCADGLRRKLSELHSGVDLVTVAADGSKHTTSAQILKLQHANPVERVYDVAPGVQLTYNHMLLVKESTPVAPLLASEWACEACSANKHYFSCPKCLETNVVVKGYSNILMRDSNLPHHFSDDIYQIKLHEDYYSHAVVLGSDDTYLAETLRSEADLEQWDTL